MTSIQDPSSNDLIPTKEEIDLFFKLKDTVEKHSRAVAELCTDIYSSEEIESVIELLDGKNVRIFVWNSDCGHDFYDMPKEYLSMSVDEVRQIIEEKKRKERERRKAAYEKGKAKREANRAKKEAKKLEKERLEYERLKKKFGEV